jgi:opacity protein-like surface antigen
MRTTLLVLLLGLAVSSTASAQFLVGPAFGYRMDLEEDFLVFGADARYDVDTLNIDLFGFPATLNGRFNYYQEENATFYQLDVNILLNPCPQVLILSPYMGMGAGVQRFSFDSVGGFEADAETDLGLNLVSGFYLKSTRSFQPFVQAQYTAVNNNPNLMAVTGGLLFRFNR